jgi:hypothetical protein
MPANLYNVTIEDIRTNRHNEPVGTATRVLLVRANSAEQARRHAYRPHWPNCQRVVSVEPAHPLTPQWHVGPENDATK